MTKQNIQAKMQYAVACILLHQAASTSYEADMNAVNTVTHRL
jgi:hypothetical protein